jgi:hypothetical protein
MLSVTDQAHDPHGAVTLHHHNLLKVPFVLLSTASMTRSAPTSKMMGFNAAHDHPKAWDFASVICASKQRCS